eukprot:CAMPEP_0114232006 /NCGR_PEP_ID=MMETSP0058-20121206/4367_1 /TAXON_ID=36894 /ORGANISM="Pyramimonas parkeae, CCMP726" /LENGTH=264 /DNA_ID=CAMNT_0001343433 /DNA_START=321 /DNA_END=1112 /DNA_ORIENTATION=+
MGACCAKPQTNEVAGGTSAANHVDPVIKAPPPPALVTVPGQSALKSSAHEGRSTPVPVPANPSPTVPTPASPAVDPDAGASGSSNVRRLSAPVIMPPDMPDDTTGWTSMASGDFHVIDRSAESTPRMASTESGGASPCPWPGKIKRPSNLNPDADTAHQESKEHAAGTPSTPSFDSNGALAATETTLAEGKRSLEMSESPDPKKSMKPSLDSIAEPDVELEAINVTLSDATPTLGRAVSGHCDPEAAAAAEEEETPARAERSGD